MTRMHYVRSIPDIPDAKLTKPLICTNLVITLGRQRKRPAGTLGAPAGLILALP